MSLNIYALVSPWNHHRYLFTIQHDRCDVIFLKCKSIQLDCEKGNRLRVIICKWQVDLFAVYTLSLATDHLIPFHNSLDFFSQIVQFFISTHRIYLLLSPLSVHLEASFTKGFYSTWKCISSSRRWLKVCVNAFSLIQWMAHWCIRFSIRAGYSFPRIPQNDCWVRIARDQWLILSVSDGR